MAIELREALKQIDINQTTGVMLIKGIEGAPVDQDLRYVLNDDDRLVVEQYQANTGKWVASSLKVGSASIEVGDQVTIGDLGSVISYKLKRLPNQHRVMPYYSFDKDNGTVIDLRVPNMIGDTNISITTNSGTVDREAGLNGSEYRLNSVANLTDNLLGTMEQSFIAGDTPPTAPVRYRIFSCDNCDTESELIIDMWLPLTLWDGKSPGDVVTFDLVGTHDAATPIAAEGGLDYFTLYSSDNVFSFYGNSTAIMDRITGQEYEYLNFIHDNPIWLEATSVSNLEHTHTINAQYLGYTNDNEIELTIPYGTTSSFEVYDAGNDFDDHEFIVKIMNQDGVTVDHTVYLDDESDESYKFFYNKDNGYWYYIEIGNGRAVKIASTHRASTDFI